MWPPTGAAAGYGAGETGKPVFLRSERKARLRGGVSRPLVGASMPEPSCEGELLGGDAVNEVEATLWGRLVEALEVIDDLLGPTGGSFDEFE